MTALCDLIREVNRIGKTVEELRDEAREALRANPAYTGTDNIITGSYELLNDLVDDNTAAIFVVDPPWQRRYVHLYGGAAELAARKLRPGGLLLAVSSNDHPLEVGHLLEQHLMFRHYFFVRYARRMPVRHETEIGEAGQLLWLFQKPPKVRLWRVPMRTIDGEPDKRYHPWGQGEKEVTYYLEHLARPGSLVVDPIDADLSNHPTSPFLLLSQEFLHRSATLYCYFLPVSC